MRDRGGHLWIYRLQALGGIALDKKPSIPFERGIKIIPELCILLGRGIDFQIFMILMARSTGINGFFMILIPSRGEFMVFRVLGMLWVCLWETLGVPLGPLVFLWAPRWASLVSISSLGRLP